MPHTEFTLWLTPREPMRSALGDIIQKLAADYGAVAFDPHVTVFCGPSTETKARSICERIAGEFSPIALTADGLDQTQSFTKTLFIQFQQSDAAQRMFEVARGYSELSDYTLNPHLSLVYAKLPEANRRELCRTLDVPVGRYQFDRIRLIETELPIEDDGPVRRWRVAYDEALQG